MEERISIVTLGVGDLDRAVRFYEAMGLTRNRKITEGVAFFQMGGAILSLFPKKEAEADSGVTFGAAPSAVYLAYNTRSEAEVDAVLAQAEAAGGAVRRIHFVDAEFAAMRIAGKVGQQIAQQPVHQPRFAAVGLVQLLEGDIEFVQALVAAFIDTRRLAGRADKHAAEQIGKAGVVLPERQQAAQ